MPRDLIRKDPSSFKTLQLFVEATPEGLCYQGLGRPLNFSEMLEKRQPVTVTDSQRFAVELANLGVSVRLTLSWQGRDYWLLVRQRRADRGDCRPCACRCRTAGRPHPCGADPRGALDRTRARQQGHRNRRFPHCHRKPPDARRWQP